MATARFASSNVGDCIVENHIEIYTKDFCPYCDKAKALFDTLGYSWQEKRVDLEPQHFDDLRKRVPSARTMPQIFINGKHIGGCDDLYALQANGELSDYFLT